MEPKVLMTSELGGESVRKSSDAHLDAVSVFDEGRAVLAYEDFRRSRLREILGHERGVVLDEIVEAAYMYEVSVCVRYVRIDHCNAELGALDCRYGAVHRSAERYVSILVRKRYLHQCGSELDGSAPVEELRLSEMYREVVGVAAVHVGPDVRPDEETLLEENAFVSRLGIRRRTFRMEMMEVKVFHLSGVRPAAESLDEDMRDACHTAEMYMAVGLDSADGFVG